MEMDIVALISQVGFPIAVATYTLVRLNSTIGENTKMLNAIYQKLMGEVPKGE
jgi:hypothetical protein